MTLMLLKACEMAEVEWDGRCVVAVAVASLATADRPVSRSVLVSNIGQLVAGDQAVTLCRCRRRHHPLSLASVSAQSAQVLSSRTGHKE